LVKKKVGVVQKKGLWLQRGGGEQENLGWREAMFKNEMETQEGLFSRQNQQKLIIEKIDRGPTEERAFKKVRKKRSTASQVSQEGSPSLLKLDTADIGRWTNAKEPYKIRRVGDGSS